ncbi:NIPSNAP family protein [Planctomycetales bacterium 10988]|nr:NIPSNAP family protein [Planctomycetales bacterium 10988]
MLTLPSILTPVAALAFLVLMIGFTPASAEVYELRTYTTNEGKLDDLNQRFRNHTVELFNKHGMESVGYWVPTEAPKSENTLIYVLKHQSREAAKASWKAFGSDPAWKKVAKESQQDGKILAKKPESVFMELTDYSPSFATDNAESDAVFELRIYRCHEGKLPNLDARFRDHTIGLFQRYGMQSVAYWHPAEEPASEDTLIYIIKHASPEAAKESWQSFREDEEWQTVVVESQRDGKFLRERPESIYMKATDYSEIQ